MTMATGPLGRQPPDATHPRSGRRGLPLAWVLGLPLAAKTNGGVGAILAT
jgi:hypothetical protein